MKVLERVQFRSRVYFTIFGRQVRGSGGYSLGTLGVFSGRKYYFRLEPFLVLSFSQDHQLKSSQLELIPYSAGDSDV